MGKRIVLAFVAACGSSSSGSDSATDATECSPTGAPGPVTVNGPLGGTPAMQVTFIAHDATGAMISRSAVMGPGATATLDVPPCGMVSVVTHDSGSAHVMTWVALQPGDRLGTGLGATTPHALSVHLAALPGATSYQVSATCSPDAAPASVANAVPGVVTMSADCAPAASSVSVLATASTPSGLNTALTTVPLATGTTDVPMPAYQPAGASTLRLHHADAFVGAGVIYTDSAAIGTDRELMVGFADVNIAGAEASIGPVPAIAGTGVGYVLLKSSTATINVTRGVAEAAADFDVDVATLLPLPTGSVDVTTSRPSVTWAVDRAFDADAVLVSVDLNSTLWTMFAPPVPGTLRYPELPADLVPGPPATVFGFSLFDSTAVTSYRELFTGAGSAGIPAPGEQVQTNAIGYNVP